MVSMRSIFEYLWRDPYRVIGFVGCCIILTVSVRKDAKVGWKRLWNRLAFPALLCVIIFINPVTTHILVKRSEETQFLRFFWIAPVSLTVAATLVCLLEKIRNNYLKSTTTIVTLWLIFALGGRYTQLLHNTWQNTFSNPYKIPPVIIEVCDYIMEDDATEDKSLALTMPLNLWIRQYAPQIRLQFVWGSLAVPEEESKSLFLAMAPEEGLATDLDDVSFWARNLNISYVLLQRDKCYTGSMETNGYEEVTAFQCETEDETNVYGKEYLLYCLTEEQQE